MVARATLATITPYVDAASTAVAAEDRGKPVNPLRASAVERLVWRVPPSDRDNVPDRLPTGRPPVIAVVGSSGFRASWQAGVLDALEDIVDPIRLDLASGGTIPGLALAAGIGKHRRRIINAGAPTGEAITRVGGPTWYERGNLDLAGIYHLDGIERWLAAWLEWAGIRTFRDLRYRPGDSAPRGVTHRVGIGVVVWRTAGSHPRRFTAAELRDPPTIRRLFRWAFFGRQFPWKHFRQMWIPDTVGEHLPWLAGEIDDHSPAFWARVSMSQWPFFLPTVLQDPDTGHLVFLADGGHIDNQPSLFNDGRVPDHPIINPRLTQNGRQNTRAQRERDARRMPFGHVARFPTTADTRVGLSAGARLDWAARDRMWLTGLTQGRRSLPRDVRLMAYRYASARQAAERGLRTRIEVPGLHGFQAIAAAERPGRKVIIALRS
ncbi:patatin-like phospholipase family protein [Embleya hyalina]|nr:patatin-like phospholipase family protein [Embleya hyalina]